MKLYRVVFNKMATLIDSYAHFNPTTLSLKKIKDFGKNSSNEKLVEVRSYEFLKEELLVRLAQMSKEMVYLPDHFFKNSSVQLVYSWYMKSFEDVFNFKQKGHYEKDLKDFTNCLNNIVDRHADVVQNLAMGILQVKESCGIDNKTERKIQYFLDRFLMSRISIRMLINQHVMMFGEKRPEHSYLVGAIDTQCDVLEVLEDAYNNAKFLCDHHYMCSPEVEYAAKNFVDKDEKSIKLVYVPSHLYQMAFELYKNAMRAVIETYGPSAKTFPKIQTLVCKGSEDITIRITDFGGGIPKSKIPFVFKYMYTTAPRPSIQPDLYSESSNAPISGLGYGLPLSRLIARYFNGDLQLCSMEGHSTDAYIYLKTFSKDANEYLPLHNKTSEFNYKSHREPNSDWTDRKSVV